MRPDRDLQDVISYNKTIMDARRDIRVPEWNTDRSF